jgi:hypothetical protein
MRNCLIIPAIILFTFETFCQTPTFPIDNDSKKITYTEVVELGKGVKKSVIQTRAKAWVAKKQFLAKNKQAEGTYSFKGKFVLHYPSATTGKNERGSVEFICTLYLKDGRYKYVLTNFKHVGESGRGSGGALENEVPECGKFVLPMGSWTKIKNEVYSLTPPLVTEMKQALAGATVVVKKKNPADF